MKRSRAVSTLHQQTYAVTHQRSAVKMIVPVSLKWPHICRNAALATMLGVASISASADDIIQTTATTTVVVPDLQPTAEPAKIVRSEKSTPNEFVSLIRETGLDGWNIHEGKASAWQREGDIISCLASTGGWLRTQAEYSDFVLRLEYRLQAGGNTGIGLRAPSAGNPTFTGLEIQLLDDTAEKYADLRPDQYTGSVYYQVPARERAKLKPLGEWNTCEIHCIGDLVTVSINGELINEVQLAKRKATTIAGQSENQSPHQLSQRPPLGHIALQSHSSRVDFRKIEILDKTTQTPTGLRYVDLTPGTGENVGSAQSVSLHYVGQLTTGQRFTDTRDLGAPVLVSMDAVIPGMSEGIRSMKMNGRRRIIVPPHLAYGAEGVANVIPPDSTLIFEVEVCDTEQ